MGAFTLGLDQGIAAANRQTQHTQGISDQEREQAVADKNRTIGALQTKMAQVGPNHPDYPTYQSQLNQAVADRTALFHPSQPGALEHLGRMVWNKVHPQDPAPEPDPRITSTTIQTATPGMTSGPMPGAQGNITTPDLPAIQQANPNLGPSPLGPADLKSRTARVSQEMGWGAAASQPQNPGLVFRSQLKAALPNTSEADLDQATRIHEGIAARPIADKQSWEVVPGTMNGEPTTLQRNKFTGDFQTLGGDPVSSEAMSSFRPSGKTGKVPTTSEENYIRSWYPDGGTAEQREWALKRRYRMLHPDTQGSHESIQYDANGDAHIVHLATDNHKEVGPEGPPPGINGAPYVAPSSSGNPTLHAHLGQAPAEQAAPASAQPAADTATPPPATPAQVKAHVARAQAIAAANPVLRAPGSDSRVAGLHKNTPDQNHASQRVTELNAAARMGDAALQSGSPEDQRLFVGTLQKSVEGRFNQGAYDNLSTNYGLGNRFENFLNRTYNGALPDAVIKGLVQGAHHELDTARAAKEDAYGRGGATAPAASGWSAPADAPPAPKEDNHLLKKKGVVIAVSRGGQWANPNTK